MLQLLLTQTPCGGMTRPKSDCRSANSISVRLYISS